MAKAKILESERDSMNSNKTGFATFEDANHTVGQIYDLVEEQEFAVITENGKPAFLTFKYSLIEQEQASPDEGLWDILPRVVAKRPGLAEFLEKSGDKT